MRLQQLQRNVSGYLWNYVFDIFFNRNSHKVFYLLILKLKTKVYLLCMAYAITSLSFSVADIGIDIS